MKHSSLVPHLTSEYFAKSFNHKYIFNAQFLKYDAPFFLILLISYVLFSKIIKLIITLLLFPISQLYSIIYLDLSCIYLIMFDGIYKLENNDFCSTLLLESSIFVSLCLNQDCITCVLFLK